MRVLLAWLGVWTADTARAACPTSSPDRTVCPGGACDYTTIAAAVSAANNDDVVCVDPGVYNTQIVANNKHVRVESSGPGVVVNGGSGGEIVRIENNADLELVGIDIDGNNQRRCIFVTGVQSSLVLEGSDVSDCIQGTDGAGIFLGSQTFARIEDSTFSDNGSGGNSGGAVFATGATSLDVLRTTFEGGRSGTAGAIRLQSTPATLDDVTFDDNEASAGNGGSVFSDGSGALTVLGGSFARGFSSNDGGCLAVGGSVTLEVVGTVFDGGTGRGAR
ncbi:MAG: right-handed parallel beta-helix repeat-containing protein [Myxococcota bacterium]